ncbi:hypothetical protein [Streptomyces sp. KL116D]|uniref:hypothetical protein n=1 Tax=Streptomyces sp. KL116D TaxID=3045152 RepID=UPI00355774C1
MTSETLRLRQEDFNRRAGKAALDVYLLAAAGGGDPGKAVTDPYRELLDAAERRFRAAADSGDLQGMADGWNELTDIFAHAAHANARLGAALLATVANKTGLAPEEAITKTIELIENS